MHSLASQCKTGFLYRVELLHEKIRTKLDILTSRRVTELGNPTALSVKAIQSYCLKFLLTWKNVFQSVADLRGLGCVIRPDMYLNSYIIYSF